jgi:hypothetical protein
VTDPYDVYNTVIDIMCVDCDPDIKWDCEHLPEGVRCRTKIYCMKHILKRDDEEYPTKLPKVK